MLVHQDDSIFFFPFFCVLCYRMDENQHRYSQFFFQTNFHSVFTQKGCQWLGKDRLLYVNSLNDIINSIEIPNIIWACVQTSKSPVSILPIYSIWIFFFVFKKKNVHVSTTLLFCAHNKRNLLWATCIYNNTDEGYHYPALFIHVVRHLLGHQP